MLIEISLPLYPQSSFRREHIFSHLDLTLNIRRNKKKRRSLKGNMQHDREVLWFWQKSTPPNFSATSEKKESKTRKRKSNGKNKACKNHCIKFELIWPHIQRCFFFQLQSQCLYPSSCLYRARLEMIWHRSSKRCTWSLAIVQAKSYLSQKAANKG